MLRIDRQVDPTTIIGKAIRVEAHASQDYLTGVNVTDAPFEGSQTFPKVTLQLKGCERCGGDVTTGRDWHGDYLQCLQCGWYKDSPGDALSHLVESAMTTLMQQMERPRAS